jgi:hypothetical protein
MSRVEGYESYIMNELPSVIIVAMLGKAINSFYSVNFLAESEWCTILFKMNFILSGESL